MIKELVIVGLGAFLGGLARYSCMILMPNYLFFVNTLGSFLVGIFYFKLCKTFPNQHLLINVGFLGAFTTFSSFSLLVLQQLNEGLFLRAFLYVVVKILAGLVFCFLGYKLASNVLI